MNLYTIEQEYRDIEQAIEDAEGEITPELEARISINEGDRAGKISAYVHIIREREAAAVACRNEAQRLVMLATAHENLAGRLRDTLLAVVLEHGPVRADTYMVALRRSKYVEVSGDVGEEWRFEQKPAPPRAPDKRRIAVALKAGLAVVGAELRERAALVLK